MPTEKNPMEPEEPSRSQRRKRAQLAQLDPEILTADGFDDALIGYVERCGQPTIAAYDVPKCIQVLQDQGMTEDAAIEYFNFNVQGAWLGDRTPAWLTLL